MRPASRKEKKEIFSLFLSASGSLAYCYWTHAEPLSIDARLTVPWCLRKSTIPKLFTRPGLVYTSIPTTLSHFQNKTISQRTKDRKSNQNNKKLLIGEIYTYIIIQVKLNTKLKTIDLFFLHSLFVDSFFSIYGLSVDHILHSTFPCRFELILL